MRLNEDTNTYLNNNSQFISQSLKNTILFLAKKRTYSPNSFLTKQFKIGRYYHSLSLPLLTPQIEVFIPQSNNFISPLSSFTHAEKSSNLSLSLSEKKTETRSRLKRETAD